MASSTNSSPVDPMQHLRVPFQPPRLTVSGVYELGKDIAREMQQISGGQPAAMPVVEKVVKTLEWLELYVEEAEELRTANCKLQLKADELAAEKVRRKNIELELKGMQLVAEERGRQRDSLALRISELEAQIEVYQETVKEFEQSRVNSFRRQRYLSSKIVEVEDDSSTCTTSTSDYKSRTKSLDRKDKHKVKKATVEQLQKELNFERKKVTELRESRALEQRRIQQRLKHMDDEINELKKQLSISQVHIEKLKEEKADLIERSEVLNEVKAINLATVARGNVQQLENGDSAFEAERSSTVPQFYKKDLVAILKERNEFKEKICNLQEELKQVHKKLGNYESGSSDRSRGPSPFTNKRSLTLPHQNHINKEESSLDNLMQRVEDSLVIVEIQVPTKNNSRPSSRNSLRLNNSASGSIQSVNSPSESVPIPLEKTKELSGSTSL